MADVTTSENTTEAFAKYNKDQMLKYAVIIIITGLVAWFAYKSFFR